MNYKDNETVNITLERYENLKESSDYLYKLVKSLVNSATITSNKELLISKEKIIDTFMLTDNIKYRNCFTVGNDYDDIELKNIKFTMEGEK